MAAWRGVARSGTQLSNKGPAQHSAVCLPWLTQSRHRHHGPVFLSWVTSHHAQPKPCACQIYTHIVHLYYLRSRYSLLAMLKAWFERKTTIYQKICRSGSILKVNAHFTNTLNINPGFGFKLPSLNTDGVWRICDTTIRIFINCRPNCTNINVDVFDYQIVVSEVSISSAMLWIHWFGWNSYIVSYP